MLGYIYIYSPMLNVTCYINSSMARIRGYFL